MNQESRISAALPEFARERCEEYHCPPCRDIFCQGSQGQGQVKPSSQGTRWVGDRRSGPRSREWRWSKTRVFARGFWPVVRGTFEQFKTRLLRVVGRERLGGEGSIRLRRPPCCPRCLLRARAAVRTVQERRAHELRLSDYEKGRRHPSINPIGGGEYLRSDRWRRWPGGVSIT